ncbi:hypothetical protein DYY67_2113 [Candidatus Nitrosotalea sp. TS]|nr:hypothetical protein [Candidatus Nitrosotalea sp. TS]
MDTVHDYLVSCRKLFFFEKIILKNDLTVARNNFKSRSY